MIEFIVITLVLLPFFIGIVAILDRLFDWWDGR